MAKVLNIGFTGTRRGMTEGQKKTLERVLSPAETTWSMFSEFHHGDCIGADDQAHDILMGLIEKHWPLRVDIVVHPPEAKRFRAFRGMISKDIDLRKRGLIKILPEDKYLERDYKIVRASDVMIAAPFGVEADDMNRRSGTWYTIRLARKYKKRLTIIWPDGSTTMETPEKGERK